jgi:hypothetical protein
MKEGHQKMFRKMRRIKQLLSTEDVNAIMERCTNGILACLGDEDYPYAVPVSYTYSDGKIYIHSAKAGHKVDAIIKNPKVSFAVVDEDQIVGAEYTTYFRSVIAFGKARIAEGEERINAFRDLVEKYSASQPEEEKFEKIHDCNTSHIIAVDVEHITGKEAIEFVRMKESK